MNKTELQELRRIAGGQEAPMTRVALGDIANPRTMRRQLQKAFEASLRAKDGTKGLTQRLQKVANFSQHRARTIAITESTRAANEGRMASIIDEYLTAYDKAVRGHRKRPQLPLVQWINPRAAKEPRPHHVHISGTIKPVGEEFLPGLRYPGDLRADASEVINCHCYIRRVRGARA